MRSIRVRTLMVALVLSGPTAALTAGAGTGSAYVGPPVPQTQYAQIPIYAVRTADDDGSNAAWVSASTVQNLIAGVNEIYADAGIQFTFDPAEDFPPVVNSTLLNQDFTVAAGADMTNPDKPAYDEVPHAHAREAFAVQHNDHVVVFFRWGTKLVWAEPEGPWQVQMATVATSSDCGLRVRMTAGGGSATSLAHELGHYFHCGHTFGSQPATVSDATAKIRDYVQHNNIPASQGLKVFNGDGLSDTPPDAGPRIFEDAYGEGAACSPPDTISIPVGYGPDGSSPFYNYSLAPDKDNIMSYFKGCPGPKHFSPMQIDRIHASLQGGNRSHLVGGQRGAHMAEDYKATWSANTSILVSFTLDQRPHILAYAPNGAVRIDRVNDKKDDVTNVWSSTWSTGYTSIAPLELNGLPYVLLYKKATGYVQVVKVNAGGQGVSGVWAGTWSLYTDYTSLMPFTQDGFPHALMYRKDDGRVHLLKFTGFNPQMIWTGTWNAGYTSLMPFDQDGRSRALLYNKDTGVVRVVRIHAGGGYVVNWSDNWSAGYTSIALLRRGGVEPHALLYRDTGSARIVQIKPNGQGITGVWFDWWSTGYTSIVPFHFLHPSLLLYKAGSGSAQIVKFCL